MTIKRDRTKGYLFIALAGLLLALVAALAIGGATADSAQAQGLAICDEYPGLPGCQEGAGGGGGDAPGAEQGAGANAVPGSGGPTGGTDGTLPFTGYPITALLLLLLVLLATGLTIRAYLAIRDRVRARESGGPTRIA